jgi:hypothetical protein
MAERVAREAERALVSECAPLVAAEQAGALQALVHATHRDADFAYYRSRGLPGLRVDPAAILGAGGMGDGGGDPALVLWGEGEGAAQGKQGADHDPVLYQPRWAGIAVAGQGEAGGKRTDGAGQEGPAGIEGGWVRLRVADNGDTAEAFDTAGHGVRQGQGWCTVRTEAEHLSRNAAKDVLFASHTRGCITNKLVAQRRGKHPILHVLEHGRCVRYRDGHHASCCCVSVSYIDRLLPTLLPPPPPPPPPPLVAVVRWQLAARCTPPGACALF